jgi:hypothetical protein
MHRERDRDRERQRDRALLQTDRQVMRTRQSDGKLDRVARTDYCC